MFRLHLEQQIQLNLGDRDGQNKCHELRGREMRMKFWWGNPKAREYLQDLGIYGSMILD
jgi:hypothetical protein